MAFIPGAPRIVLEPELALALFLAPVLLDAAYDTSPRDLRRDVPLAHAPAERGVLVWAQARYDWESR